jgi:hypothetical protein
VPLFLFLLLLLLLVWEGEIYEELFCWSDIGIISVESSGRQEKKAERREEKNSPSSSLRDLEKLRTLACVCVREREREREERAYIPIPILGSRFILTLGSLLVVGSNVDDLLLLLPSVRPSDDHSFFLIWPTTSLFSSLLPPLHYSLGGSCVTKGEEGRERASVLGSCIYVIHRTT